MISLPIPGKDLRKTHFHLNRLTVRGGRHIRVRDRVREKTFDRPKLVGELIC